MAGSFSLKLGTRLSVGLLAAAYLWNLSLLFDKDELHEVRWDTFETSNFSNQLRNNRPKYSSARDHDGRIVNFLKPTGLKISLPPPEKRAPGFIIIGTQKGGTQALKTYLEEHPMIEIPTEYAETHFFDWGWDENKTAQENFKVYVEKYFGQDCRKNDCIAGESTPSYMYDTENVPVRVNAVCPWVKLIVILRDPAKRAQSQHNMLVEKDEIGEKAKDFVGHLNLELKWMKEVGLISNTTLSHEEEYEAWIKYQDHRKWRKFMLGRGMYEIQLREWFKYFPRDQFLILKSEDLDRERSATMRRVYDFLGVPDQLLKKDKKVHARNYTKPVLDEVQRFLYDFYRPYNQRLESLLGPGWKGVWEKPSS
jgi:hypothetical protein